MVSAVEETFGSIIDKYKVGNIEKEQALNEAESKYKSAVKENEQKINDILEKHRFYLFVPCSADELIKVYDKTLNGTTDFERKEHERTIQKILSVIPVEFMEEFEGDIDAANIAAPLVVYKERDEIAKLCQENRIITEDYEKCKAKMNDQLLQNGELNPNDMPPPVINSMIEAKILESVKDRDGKYPLNKGYTDRKAIAWIFNNSAYDDEITPQMYYDYVFTKCKQSTIERYFSDAKDIAEQSEKSV
jgi:hypothetical protein